MHIWHHRRAPPRVGGQTRHCHVCHRQWHAARGPTPACHTAGPARARALNERLSANALCQHNMCAQRDKSWPPTWRRCYGDVTSSMHKVYTHNHIKDITHNTKTLHRIQAKKGNFIWNAQLKCITFFIKPWLPTS